MKPAEWVEVVRRVNGWWPHAQWPEATMALYFDDLKHLERGVVLEAVTAVYRDGREFPPSGAQILAEAAKGEVGAPDFDHAWREVTNAVQTIGGATPDRARRCADHLHEIHPLVAELACQVGIQDIAMSKPGDTTLRAQARRIYESIGERAQRQHTHHDLATAKRRGGLDGPRNPRGIGSAVIGVLEAVRGKDAA